MPYGDRSNMRQEIYDFFIGLIKGGFNVEDFTLSKGQYIKITMDVMGKLPKSDTPRVARRKERSKCTQ